jgi:hypothetical protein
MLWINMVYSNNIWACGFMNKKSSLIIGATFMVMQLSVVATTNNYAFQINVASKPVTSNVVSLSVTAQSSLAVQQIANEITADYTKILLKQESKQGVLAINTAFEGAVQADYVLSATDGSVLLNGEVRIAAGARVGSLNMEDFPAGNYIFTMTVRSKVTRATSTYVFRIAKD